MPKAETNARVERVRTIDSGRCGLFPERSHLETDDTIQATDDVYASGANKIATRIRCSEAYCHSVDCVVRADTCSFDELNSEETSDLLLAITKNDDEQLDLIRKIIEFDFK